MNWCLTYSAVYLVNPDFPPKRQNERGQNSEVRAKSSVEWGWNSGERGRNSD